MHLPSTVREGLTAVVSEANLEVEVAIESLEQHRPDPRPLAPDIWPSSTAINVDYLHDSHVH